MAHWREIRTAWLAVALAAALAGRALAQEAPPLPIPTEITVEDTPSDNGRKLTVRFPVADGETPELEYEVQVAPGKEGPFRKAARFFAAGKSPDGKPVPLALAKDLFDDYGPFARTLTGHGVIVKPLAHYPSAQVAEAVLGPLEVDALRTAIGLVTPEDGPKALARLIARAGTLGETYAALPGPGGTGTLGTGTIALIADLGKKEAPTGADFVSAKAAALDVVAAVADAYAAKRKVLADELGEEALGRVAEACAGLGVARLTDRAGWLAKEVDEAIERSVADRTWYARVVVHHADGRSVISSVTGEGRPAPNLFAWKKLNTFVVFVVLTGLVLHFIAKARKNPDMYLRRIRGLDAVDEALGRATEMGKPVLFVHGLKEMKEVSTIAAVSILGEISKHVASFDTKLICATMDPVVLAVSQETVREGFTRAGRPDAYNEDDVFLAAAEQFAYVAAVDGIMLRQRPAANFYCGYFYAESLILAETGAVSGAIQIAATDAFTQLPFFVTTCDYTLMGEELYAASAYLSRDPLLLGSLKGQDMAKAIMMVFLVVGTLLVTLGATIVLELLMVVSS